MLSVSGQLNNRMYGPSIRPKLPEGASKRYAWEADKKTEDQRRRSIFVFAKRNMRFPMFDSFDLPDMHNSCGQRTQSTTPPQALLMLNSDDTLDLAHDWARDLHNKYSGDRAELIQHAYTAALGRGASRSEVAAAAAFLIAQSSLVTDGEEKSAEKVDPISPHAVADLCHALFNCNEFIYID
jgi:hypothetical protein